MDDKMKYGIYKGKFCADMTRDELLEVVYELGEQNYFLRNKPSIDDEVSAFLNPSHKE